MSASLDFDSADETPRGESLWDVVVDVRILDELDGDSPLTLSKMSEAIHDALGRPMRYAEMARLVARRLEALVAVEIVLMTDHPDAAVTFYYGAWFEALARASGWRPR